MLNLTLNQSGQASNQHTKGIPVWAALGGAFTASAVLWTVGWFSVTSFLAG